MSEGVIHMAGDGAKGAATAPAHSVVRPPLPLSLVKPGETVAIKRVKGDEAMKHHLNEIGFVEGAEAHVVSSSGSNIIVMIKGARFGLDVKVARHVMTV